MSKIIYVAEDELNIRNLIVTFLQQEKYTVVGFETGDDLLTRFKEAPADLVILDVMMPGSSGFVICNKLREITNVPILFLTARDSDEDFITGLSLGSDAYVTKPFSPTKLMVQIKAMFRRMDYDLQKIVPDEGVVEKEGFGDLRVCDDKLSIFINGALLKLTSTEYGLLVYLVKNAHRAVSRTELLAKIWSFDAMVETRATDDTVKRLRKKLRDAKSCVVIETVRGFGFSLKLEDE